MREMEDWRKIGACCGVGFVILFIVGFALQGDPPMTNDSAAQIRDYFADKGDTYIIGDFFFALGFTFFFLPFLSVLTSHLAGAEGTPPVWSWVVFGIGVAMIGVGGALSGVQGAIAYREGAGLSDEVLTALVSVSYYSNILVWAFGTGLLALAASMIMLRRRVFWPWLGWLGMAYAPLAVVSFFALLGDEPDEGLGILTWIAFLVFGIWVLIVSAALWRASEPASRMQTAGGMADAG